MSNMFCFQCEQTAGGKACTMSGVCGKDAVVANGQDDLTCALVGLARAANGTGEPGRQADELMMKKKGWAELRICLLISFGQEMRI